MKKYLLASVFGLALLTSCDDGDVVYKDLDFGGKNVEKCATKNFYYKASKNEMIILDIPADTLMKNILYLEQLVGDNNQVLYRSYDSDVDGKAICENLPPKSPLVMSELLAQSGGKILIDKNIANTVNEDRKTVSVAYNYTFNFYNIKFTDGDTELKFDRLNFGTYKKSDSPTFNLNFTNTNNQEITPKEAYLCEEKHTLVTINSNNTLLLNLPENFEFPTSEGTVTFNIGKGSDLADLTFKQYYNGGLNSVDICSYNGTITETRNRLLEQWQADRGVVEMETRKTVPADGGTEKWSHILRVKNPFFIKHVNNSTEDYSPYGFEIQELVFGKIEFDVQ